MDDDEASSDADTLDGPTCPECDSPLMDEVHALVAAQDETDEEIDPPEEFVSRVMGGAGQFVEVRTDAADVRSPTWSLSDREWDELTEDERRAHNAWVREVHDADIEVARAPEAIRDLVCEVADTSEPTAIREALARLSGRAAWRYLDDDEIARGDLVCGDCGTRRLDGGTVHNDDMPEGVVCAGCHSDWLRDGAA